MNQSTQRDSLIPIARPSKWPAGSTPLRAISIWGISAIFVLFQFFLQLSSGEMVQGLMQSFQLSALGAGLLASMYYYVYVILQTPAGLLTDRIGVRVLLSSGACVCGVGCWLFASSHWLSLAILGRLLMGTGAAFAFVGSLNLAANWFPSSRFTLLAALAETSGMLGSIVGGLFLVSFIEKAGWRYAMQSAAWVLIIIGVLLWLIVRNRPRQAFVPPLPEQQEFWQGVVKLIKNKTAWLNGIYSGLLFAVVTAFVGLWGIPYFEISHHFSLVTATHINQLTFIGVAVGGPLYGWLDTRMIRRRLFLMVSPLLGAVILGIIIFIPNLSTAWLSIWMILLGLVISSYIVNFGIANEIVVPQLRSTSMGFINTLSVSSAPIVQPIIGGLLSMHAHYFDGIEQYTLHDYQSALLVLPALLIVASALAFFLPARPYAVSRIPHTPNQ